MAGLLDALAGSDDPSTADPNTGLVEAQRRQLAFNTLGQTGALLLAAGERQMGPQRAQWLAQLGNVPANTQAMSTDMSRQNLEAQRTVAAKRQNQQQQELMAYVQTPEFQQQFQGMPPGTKALATAQAKAGDLAGMVKTVHEARLLTQPQNLGGGNIGYRQPDGGWLIMNPTSNMQMTIDSQGKPVGNGYMGSGQAADPADLEPHPETGFRETWLQKQGYSPGDQARIKRIAAGNEQFPNMRDPKRQFIIEALGTYVPGGLTEQDYKSKQAMVTSATSGPIFQKIIRPSQTFVNHAASLTDAVDALNLQDDMLGSLVINPARLKFMRNSGGKDNQLVSKFDEERVTVANEFYKFMAGNGQLTDMARKEGEGLKTAITPGAIKGHLQAMTDLMKGQIEPVAIQWAQAMKKPSGSEMIPAQTRASLAKVEAWRSGNAAPAAPQPQAAPQQSGGQAMPTPADIAYLKANPGVRGRFEQRFGPADQYLR